MLFHNVTAHSAPMYMCLNTVSENYTKASYPGSLIFPKQNLQSHDASAESGEQPIYS